MNACPLFRLHAFFPATTNALQVSRHNLAKITNEEGLLEAMEMLQAAIGEEDFEWEPRASAIGAANAIITIKVCGRQRCCVVPLLCGTAAVILQAQGRRRLLLLGREVLGRATAP
jgi:hypothetical protein